MPIVDRYQPSQLLSPGEPGYPDFGKYRHMFLAQGDSWFSVGGVPPVNTSLLTELNLQSRCMAVNCAAPGYTLKGMTDHLRDHNFTQLLVGVQAWHWDAILMSAGGNDLIDAVQVLTPAAGAAAANPPHPLHQPLLLLPAAWKPGPGADRYISDPGWTHFSNYLAGQFAILAQLRDGPLSKSRGVPVFVHCYDYLQARNAPAGPGLGPWLYPAVLAYGIPQQDWPALGVELITRFRTLLKSMTMPNLHVVDDTPGTLVPAVAGSTGHSNDWENEIHPTTAGYRKLAAKYATAVEHVLPP